MNEFNERLIPIEVEEPVRIPPAVHGGEVRTIMVKVPAMRDPSDGEIYLGPEAAAILDKAKARHMGVLAPQELAELRRRLDLTQGDIADLLQIGEKSWSRWETGREIPSRSINLLLLALYEGKISLPWLRSQRTNDGVPAPTPVLRVHGWEMLYQSQFDWSGMVTLHDTRADAIAAAISHIWQAPFYSQISPTINASVQRRRPIRGTSFPDGISIAGKTERMPLCA